MANAAAHAPALDVFSGARMKLDDMIAQLSGEETAKLGHADVERLIASEGSDLLRKLLQGFLDGQGPGVAAQRVLGTDGKSRTHAREKERTIQTTFGEVVVSRMAYEAHSGPSLVPRDAELNLPATRYSHEVQQRIAREALRGSIDDAIEAVAETTAARVPKRQALELVEVAASDFAAFYASKSVAKAREVAQTGEVLVLSFDGKGVVMRPESLREETQKAARAEQHKLRTRLCKGEKRNGKRMAQVAAVYTVAPWIRQPDEIMRPLGQASPDQSARPAAEDKRVWASLQDEPADVISSAFDEAHRRDPRHTKRWTVLVDGGVGQLRMVEQAAARHGADVTIILDFIHVTEYVWRASFALFGDSKPAGERWVAERLVRILKGESSQVAAGMRRSATLRRLGKEAREPVDKCADYLLKYSAYLHYDTYLAAGLPIATGVIEGACRHLIKDRMDITGARWGLDGAEAILRLRAIKSSGDWVEYWRFHEDQEWKRNHAVNYVDQAPPATLRPAKRAKLKVVK